MKKKNYPFAIVLSVIALVLSAYATYGVASMKDGGQDNAEFKTSVFAAIDDYIAEKSGQPTEPVEVSIDDDAVKGDPNAPVTIIEFSDFECPFCGRFFRETLPQITENYIDTGKVKYVFRDFPLEAIHPMAIGAANAAECLREQGGDDMYYEFHTVLFNNQTALDPDSLKKYAQAFDIDQTQLASCMEEGRYVAEVQKDFTDGQSYGVRGTPAFFINGIFISGAQPYAAFEKIIEEALSK